IVASSIFRKTYTRNESRRGAAAELMVAAAGLALVIGAGAANQRWLDRHFLPSFIVPRDVYVRIETIVRAAAAARTIVSIRTYTSRGTIKDGRKWRSSQRWFAAPAPITSARPAAATISSAAAPRRDSLRVYVFRKMLEATI